MGSCQRDHTLMGVGCGHLVQLPAVNRNDHRTGILRLSGKALQRTVGITVSDKYLVNGTSGSQGFGQSIAALQLTLHFLHGGIYGSAIPIRTALTVRTTMFFIHMRSLHLHIAIDNSIITGFSPFHNCYFCPFGEKISCRFRKYIVGRPALRPPPEIITSNLSAIHALFQQFTENLPPGQESFVATGEKM
jgi:hypothetical protein